MDESALRPERLRELASAIKTACGNARLNTLQFVSYAPDSDVPTAPLQWVTLSASADKYGQAVRQFTSADLPSSKEIKQTLVNDDYDEGPYWEFTHSSPAEIELPEISDKTIIQTDLGLLKEEVDNTTPKGRLNLWKVSLEAHFEESSFVALWIPQSHYDPDRATMRSHVFVLLYHAEGEPPNLYKIAKLCRDFTVQFISRYFVEYERRLRVRRMTVLSDDLTRSAKLVEILDRSTEVATDLYDMATRAELPFTIVGAVGSGKTTLALNFCKLRQGDGSPASHDQIVRIACYNELGSLKMLRKIESATERLPPLIIDDIHLASERLRERLLAFLVDRREARQTFLATQHDRVAPPVVVTADSATPALAALGNFPLSLWRILSTFSVNTRPFHKLNESEREHIRQILVSNVCAALGKSSPVNIDVVLSDLRARKDIFSLNDLSDATMRSIRIHLEWKPSL